MGRHPQRTPFYGVLMIIAAMLTGLWLHDQSSLPLRVVGYLAVAVVALVGFVMTFRDYS
ncbi:hypothetical protein [Nocardia transvalensis]|uniref:hypothetical protein n=1 Tax=Nocardia transvalensis TaxID=37333 RepID=UPI0018945C3A|nr:hypothetical protein [Nocardia transvalensis]MBF6331580.1 hypothetical protein [Nocardia transvalensis]